MSKNLIWPGWRFFIEFFPDDEEEEADAAAPAVDASGQYAFQSDGMLPQFTLGVWIFLLFFTEFAYPVPSRSCGSPGRLQLRSVEPSPFTFSRARGFTSTLHSSLLRLLKHVHQLQISHSFTFFAFSLPMGLFFMIIFFYHLSQLHVVSADCEIQEMFASFWPASIPSYRLFAKHS